MANLLYFMHPTLVCPFNTSIVSGFNAVTGSRIKLGRWDHYLLMREGMIRLNEQHRHCLSNDLGAIAGLMFDIGSSRYAAPPRLAEPAELERWKLDLQRVREESASAQKQWLAAQECDATHTQMQGWLRDMGKSLGFDVWIASNDRGREYDQSILADGCLTQLPVGAAQGLESIRLIDVVWFSQGSAQVVAAFEVEHSTSIYSGIVRMLDLALGTKMGASSTLFLVAPDDRRDDVAQQLRRPAFSRVSELGIRYLPYSAIKNHRDAIARFGTGIRPMLEISQLL